MSLFHHKEPAGGKGGKERRLFPRKATSLRINYQVGNDPTTHYNCVVGDISEGGIRLSLYQRIEKGASVKLSLYLPDSQEPALVFGKVVWESETADKQYPYDAGIQFTIFDPSFRAHIQTYLRSLE